MTTTDWTAITKAVWPEIQITPRPDGVQTRWNITSRLDGHPFAFGLALTSGDDNWEDLEPGYAAAGINAMAEYVAEHGDEEDV